MNTERHVDVVIIGAGAAGLTALRELDGAGLSVLCLEARDRIGGRILTVRDPLSPVPIELGAEFVHGRPSEIWDLVRRFSLRAYDCTDRAIRVEQGRVVEGEDAWPLVDRVMQEMQRAAEQKDVPFSVFLERSRQPADAKRLSADFVEGFNAARKEIIGIASLAADEKAADAIDGDKLFRLLSGYDFIPRSLISGIADLSRKLRLNSVVETVQWKTGSVRVRFRSTLHGGSEVVHCRRAVVSVPLGILQSDPDEPGAIRFDPEPAETLKAARSLEFGQVFRIVLRFAEPFWEAKKDFADAGFIFSDERIYPTWWTPLAIRAPILNAWSAGPHADTLEGKARPEIFAAALESLSRITRVSHTRLREMIAAAYLHDWHADPFSRGAYSYVPAGRLAARKKLAQTVERTLYFCGEATELNGHSATVHGAIASGLRSAREILAAR